MAHHPRNTFPVAGLRSGAAALPVPQRPMLSPLPQGRPFPDQPHGRAGALQNIIIPPVDAAGNRRPDDYQHGVPPLNQDIAVPGQPGYDDADYHGVVHHLFVPPVDPIIPNEYYDQGVNNYAGVVPVVPAQAQVVAPFEPVIDMADRPAQNAPAGPAPAFLNELLNQRPVPNEQLNEVLRMLANYFLNQLDSDIYVFQVEPNLAGGIRVFITLNVG